MKWTIKLVFEAILSNTSWGSSSVRRNLSGDRGIDFGRGKALLASLQQQVVIAQIQQHVEAIKSCPQRGEH
jgi:hypothetical protein